ncbi:MAG: HAD-IA family hydrolase [Armatimonadetes bacterium]|nr:HAD-IA family hydrolase [Armatimonadota bacterium]
MRPKVIFFDYGGTLAYVDPPPERIWLHLLKELGFTPNPAAFGEAFQIANETAGRLNIYDYHGRMREYWRRYDGLIFERLGIDDPRGVLADAINAGFGRPDWYHLYPDVRETLQALRSNGYQLGIISNNVDEMLERLQQLGLTRDFNTVTYSQEARADKPDPKIFRLALDRAGCRPDEAVHIGDSYEADVVGARQAGISPIFIDRDERHVGVDCLRITDLREVLPAVGSRL